MHSAKRWLLLAVLGLSGLLYAAGDGDLTAIVDSAVRHNPGLKSAEAQLEAARSGWREAQAQRLPMLSARSQWTRGDNPVYVFGSLLEQGRFGANNFAIDSLNHPSDLSNVQ